eukprot:TRINITY_DN5191_c0_g1_i1.p1 TRINITY_DN5191_c0_g1~~TRINITY_DN5191_c0_g1_i1.p1  ORF type:complete len:289 (-),score=66.54 TRINITY_DN5191_c0_g1_i1:98-964(-)
MADVEVQRTAHDLLLGLAVNQELESGSGKKKKKGKTSDAEEGLSPELVQLLQKSRSQDESDARSRKTRHRERETGDDDPNFSQERFTERVGALIEALDRDDELAVQKAAAAANREAKKIKAEGEESEEEMKIRHRKRAFAKSLFVPLMVGAPAMILFVYTTVRLTNVKPSLCERDLQLFIQVSEIFWALGAVLSVGCFVDGYRTTSRDSEKLPIGECCLPLSILLCTATLSLLVWTCFGLAWYLEAANTHLPVFACKGPYVEMTWWCIMWHYSIVATTICICFGALCA